MTLIVEVYQSAGGRRPFDSWSDALPPAHAAKVTLAIARLTAGGRSGLAPIGEGAAEWRIDWGPGLRVYLAFDGPRLVLLLGGGK